MLVTVRLVRCLAAAAGAAALLAVTALVAPTPARADGTLTMAVGGPITLVNGVYLTIPVQVSCPALAPPYVVGRDTISVGVEEKTGKALAYGEGSIAFATADINGGFGFGTPVTCDGAAHGYTVDVFPSAPDSPPFKGGPAVVQSAGFGVAWYDPTGPCFYCSIVNQSTSIGPLPVRIHG